MSKHQADRGDPQHTPSACNICEETTITFKMAGTHECLELGELLSLDGVTAFIFNYHCYYFSSVLFS